MKEYLAKLKPLVNTPIQWQAFEEMIDHNIMQHQRKLEQSTEPIDLYKAQGAIAALRHLKYLKDEINVQKTQK
ncbi:hypothetical protein UFOVP662_67 [uncultured Caudovirales phage]|uniref:Uncharacterized protein n=1 Tax=uncultured Caudovirales phage TaxID=2100421 RepID=A0A6J5QHD0_9CAUD|nr:hypothetical protein UFOVP662_67 [uncultured Caudovirales phage]CAB4181766.1 hypothetical protein UFOVP1067_67 [uncultured Caudovirales phage]